MHALSLRPPTKRSELPRGSAAPTFVMNPASEEDHDEASPPTPSAAPCWRARPLPQAEPDGGGMALSGSDSRPSLADSAHLARARLEPPPPGADGRARAQGHRHLALRCGAGNRQAVLAGVRFLLPLPRGWALGGGGPRPLLILP